MKNDAKKYIMQDMNLQTIHTITHVNNMDYDKNAEQINKCSELIKENNRKTEYFCTGDLMENITIQFFRQQRQ